MFFLTLHMQVQDLFHKVAPKKFHDFLVIMVVYVGRR